MFILKIHAKGNQAKKGKKGKANKKIVQKILERKTLFLEF